MGDRTRLAPAARKAFQETLSRSSSLWDTLSTDIHRHLVDVEMATSLETDREAATEVVMKGVNQEQKTAINMLAGDPTHGLHAMIRLDAPLGAYAAQYLGMVASVLDEIDSPHETDFRSALMEAICRFGALTRRACHIWLRLEEFQPQPAEAALLWRTATRKPNPFAATEMNAFVENGWLPDQVTAEFVLANHDPHQSSNPKAQAMVSRALLHAATVSSTPERFAPRMGM